MSKFPPKQDKKSTFAVGSTNPMPKPQQKPAANEASEKRSPVRNIEIDSDHDGQRIDNFLISTLKTVPRSLVYRILRTGQVRVNKGRIKPSFRLTEGDIVRIPPVTVPTQQQVRVPRSVIAEIETSVIAEDNNWIVINKPAGLAVHAGTGVAFGVIDGIKELFEDQSISLVHRLDRSTSGVMVLARHRKAAAHFHEALVNGHVSKHYAALICGVLPKPQTVTARLLKTHPTPNENQVLVDQVNGKKAVSHFRCRKTGKRFCLADIEIETGRTHQIRVHAASIGHPVLGDERYGDERLNKSVRRTGARRMFLHACQLSFPDMGEGSPQQTHTAAVDPDWLDILNL